MGLTHLLTTVSVLSITFLSVTGCNNGTGGSRSAAKLTGKWEVISAVNERQTPLDRLKGMTFEFAPDGKFASNIPQIKGDAYQYADGKISLKEQVDLNLSVDSLSDSRMILSMNVKEYSYIMTLEKR